MLVWGQPSEIDRFGAVTYSHDLVAAHRPFVFSTSPRDNNSQLLFDDWRLQELAGRFSDETVHFGKSNAYYSELLLMGRANLGSIVLGEFCDRLLKVRAELELPWESPPSASEVLRRSRLLAGAGADGVPLYLPRQRLSHVDLDSVGATLPDSLVAGTRSFAWIGSSPGSLHFDRLDTLLYQVAERKVVVVLPPECWPNLYLNPVSHPMPHHSRMSFWHWVRDRVEREFPQALQCSRGWTCLRPGDGLYIPAGWFHGVIADPLSVSVSFSKQVDGPRVARPPLSERLNG